MCAQKNRLNETVLLSTHNRAVVGFLKVVWPLNAVDVHRVPKARVREGRGGGGEHERGVSPHLVRGDRGTSTMKIL